MTDKNKPKAPTSSAPDFLIYTGPDGEVKTRVTLFDETIWLTQKQIADLFGVQIAAISKHLNNIFESGELDSQAVVYQGEVTIPHGAIKGRVQTSEVSFYNLDAIIAVGYRVNSKRATQFRIWATQVLKEYMIKGFALDDKRLKHGHYFGKDYFAELLEIVRSIRASERRIWQQITDIFAECSIDYNKDSQTTRDFFATVQNKFHYAIVGKTAAEIIYDSADKSKPTMGLTTWENAPKGRILKSDAAVAKNYLPQKSISQLERSVGAFFDYIENQIERRKGFSMAQFAAAVDKFLAFNDFKILTDKGKVSHEQAMEKAFAEYDEFNKTQKIESDFDKFAKKALQRGRQAE